MDWIMSEGGPLICIEKGRARDWGGIDRLTVQMPGAQSDYDRACSSNAYTTVLQLVHGSALCLSMGALDTSVWTAPSGALCLVSVVCAEPNIDEAAKLASIDEVAFEKPLHSTPITFSSSHILLFDSACPGDELEDARLEFQVTPGNYRVVTQSFDPDEEASFIVHKFLQDL